MTARANHGTAGVVAAMILLCVVQVRAASVPWEKSYVAGMRRAMKAGQPVMLDFYSQSCSWCRLMDRDVYPDDRVMESLKDYVCIKVDVQKDQRTAIAYRIGSIPRTIVVNRNARIVADRLGYMDADAFVKLLRSAEDKLDVDGPDVQSAPELSELQELQALDELSASFQRDPSMTNEFIAFLAHQDPEIREEAHTAGLDVGQALLPTLVESIAHPYLGARIAVSKLLSELVDNGPPLDPWAKGSKRRESRERWRQWLRKQTDAVPEQPPKE